MTLSKTQLILASGWSGAVQAALACPKVGLQGLSRHICTLRPDSGGGKSTVPQLGMLCQVEVAQLLRSVRHHSARNASAAAL